VRILALDQSIRRSGWALLTKRRHAVVEAQGWFGSVAASGAQSDRDKVACFKQQVRDLIVDYTPDALVWEKPMQVISRNQGRGVNAHQLILTRLDEVLVGLADEFDLYSDAVAPRTWRAMVLGKGAGALPARAAKQRARSYVLWLGINASNDDVAEAICIGLWAASCSRELPARVE
jgi:Holliday junction resolvasome RuvABC endonuclease subunit